MNLFFCLIKNISNKNDIIYEHKCNMLHFIFNFLFTVKFIKDRETASECISKKTSEPLFLFMLI